MFLLLECIVAITLTTRFFCISSIMLWAQSGKALMVMVGHTSIVYSVDAHVFGLIVNGSEDHIAKI
ncbi:hypothetical protein E1A91_D11G232700v1 [Gossypium mustelinum]|uniref:Uncharacterized protein n=1 Tax=Gossypium mustelinum TaxID=34275 RepID=A0A5D2SWP9_GOSMU|nr:hypothetical protein E1A91_D11G232700v1 [Gossypium mustelinum]